MTERERLLDSVYHEDDAIGALADHDEENNHQHRHHSRALVDYVRRDREGTGDHRRSAHAVLSNRGYESGDYVSVNPAGAVHEDGSMEAGFPDSMKDRPHQSGYYEGTDEDGYHRVNLGMDTFTYHPAAVTHHARRWLDRKQQQGHKSLEELWKSL